MNNREIKCPNCGTVIRIDESTYDSIARQIRDEEFFDELNRQKEEAMKLVAAQNESLLKEKLSVKDEKYYELEKQFNELKNRLENREERYKAEIEKVKNENQLLLSKKDNDLNSLQAKLNAKDTENRLELNKLDAKNREEINNLNSQISILNEQYRSKEESIKRNYEIQINAMQQQVDFYKDFKAKQSTKAIGEDLEHYCENQFNKTLRPILPNCYFEKDNEISKESGSKGDFIFRETDGENEIVSVMIECKNEADQTSKKHRNEDFFKELDKDRREKKCEYAVLVSTLEADNDYYNDGIVDVSYRYEKMYVVRPQQFIPLLTLLRNSSMKVLDVKRQLHLAQTQNLDISRFEENMNAFREGFEKNYNSASEHFANAIEEIDKSIAHLEKIKKELTTSENQLRLANNKAQDLSIRKLTKNAPSVAKRFAELKKEE